MSDLPEGWVLTPLGVVATVRSGIGFPLHFQGSVVGDLGFYKVGDISRAVASSRGQLREPQHRVSFEVAAKLKGTPIPKGATVFAKIGEAIHLNRRALVVEDCLVDNNVMAVKAESAITDKLLFRFMQAQDLSELARSTTVPSIRKGDVESLMIPLAPLSEQTRIATQLDTLLARIQSCNDRFDAIPAWLKRFRQAVLDQATSGALTEEWRVNAKRNSAAWKNVQLHEVIAEMRNGLAQKPTEQPPGSKILRIGAVRAGHLDLNDHRYLVVTQKEALQYELRKDDLLFTRYNGSLEFVGVCAALKQDAPNYVYPDKLIRVRARSELVLPKFIEIVFGSRPIRRQVESFVKSSAGQRGVSGADLKNVRFQLASLEEQAEIVRRVEALFALADRIEARVNAARTQAQRLSPLVLAKAFRGELVQQDPQDEPANVLLQRLAATQPAKAKASRGRPRTKTQELFATPEGVQPDTAGLPDGVWAAPDVVDEHAVTAMLVAVLQAWGGPMPQMQARLAAVLCLQPRQMTAALPAEQAVQWQRLVGPVADPLPTQVTRLQPAIDGTWRKAVLGMRARGDLVEEGSGSQATWALGPDAGQIETAGWPQGRAGWVVAYLRAQGAEAILPLLEPLTVEFVHARAA
ncbi:restriction endonuclease subunit S [Acidovorax sp. PRC11]|uniref:restriction endonuclease subunit S n=1 Tax=Acidovorax sp. PRC11 TaxID=2962592 RepID=UPI00288241A4|nr:restriction endonuclease subunit S [Acidovorax sp. PRC11]MDT0136823.1 restriction endonuclease subunit S [Acidovorax sp. PRC11]